MHFNEHLKFARDKKGLSQEFIASQLGVSQSNYSKYERGDTEIPTDLVEKVINIVKEPRLKIEYVTERRLGLFNLPLLDNIDENYTTVLDCLIEEMEEAIQCANLIKKISRNKKSILELSKSDQMDFFKHQLQIADLIMALNFNFLKAAEIFDLDLNKVQLELLMKYKQKNYYSK